VRASARCSEVDLDGGDVSIVTYAWYDQTVRRRQGPGAAVGRRDGGAPARSSAALAAGRRLHVVLMATWDAVEEAVCAMPATVSRTGVAYADAWVIDGGADWAVYAVWGADELWMVAYQRRRAAGTVTLPTPEHVDRRVTYEPTAEPTAEPAAEPAWRADDGRRARACPSPWPAPTRRAATSPPPDPRLAGASGRVPCRDTTATPPPDGHVAPATPPRPERTTSMSLLKKMLDQRAALAEAREQILDRRRVAVATPTSRPTRTPSSGAWSPTWPRSTSASPS